MEIQLPELELWKMTDCVSPSDSSLTVLLPFIKIMTYIKNLYIIYMCGCVFIDRMYRDIHTNRIFFSIC